LCQQSQQAVGAVQMIFIKPTELCWEGAIKVKLNAFMCN